MHTYIDTDTHIHIDIHTQTHHMHTRTHTHKYTRTLHTHAHTHTHVCAHTHTQAVTLPSMEVERTFGRSQLPVRAMSFSPDAALLAVAGDGENIRLLQTKDGLVGVHVYVCACACG